MDRPNIVFIMSDDHASHAISAYGSRINSTPQIDRLAEEGARFDNCFCTNAICTPSRASILTGTYNHENGVRTLFDELDGRQQTFPQLLQASGYQTALIGKWHLGHGGHADPTGFDYWNVLPGQGDYFDPVMIENGVERKYEGYVTDLITDMSRDWLQARDADRPFLLGLHHKAPHRWWLPHPRHADLYDDDRVEPETLYDDYETRSQAARQAHMRVDRHMRRRDVKADPPEGLSTAERRRWFYQRYIKDYLRCIAAVDESVGRVLDYLDEHGLTQNTIVVYTSDQGFFLGDHGWYDKRFMYEESLRMPLLVRYPALVEAGSVSSSFVLNTDFAPTFAELAGVVPPEPMSGRSVVPLLQGEPPADWRRTAYYRYWEHMSDPHYVPAHYGIRTDRYKLVYYYGEGLGLNGVADQATEPEWELFDLAADPHELRNVYDQPGYREVTRELTTELARVQKEIGDVGHH
ncbi:sulfatase [Phytoactinopolyspora endophytica]|uniref:sulfatase family protein n=1 Tax=Phytoactinopolyspora endophytica TaxID=1642495 RepID=UPI00101C144F|nr:sulfatase [Phytoactinopolyspora endophytica]